MAIAEATDFLRLVPILRGVPGGNLWSSYDAEADVLYVNFREAAGATDSELTDGDVIIRYDGDEIVGLTILHASTR